MGQGPGGAGRPGIASPWAIVARRSTPADVRRRGASLVTEEGLLPVGKTSRYDPKKSVPGIALRDKIALGTDSLWCAYWIAAS